MLTRRVVQGLAFVFILASLPIFAIRRPDIPTSENGIVGNCGAGGTGTCPFVGSEGTATLSGTDTSGNAVTVTINLYNFGYYPCPDTCQPSPVIQSAVLDVILRGPATDTVGIESFVVKGVLPNPSYVSCGGIEAVENGSLGIGCVFSPEPNGSYVQEPTPIAAADGTNTRWDFVGFDQILCATDFFDAVCEQSPFGAPNQPLGEAILAVSNSVAQNHLGTANNGYLVTLTDGTKLGTFAIPASPTKQAATTNNTQATATAITGTSFKDYTDTSQAYPQMNPDGTEYNPPGFTPLPTSNPPPCNPTNDNRTFRTAWYSYTAPSDGSVTISTAGSRYDTLIYVFTGAASQPTVVNCNDDPSGGRTLQAYTAFNVTQGTNYQIVVGETPTIPGYPLSVDGALHFSFQFETEPVILTTTITSSPNPSIFGRPVEFSAKVTSDGFGTPVGTVNFSDGSTTLGKSTLSSGIAKLSAVPLSAGVNSITASFSGDFGDSSGAIDELVNRAKTRLALYSNQNLPGLGQPVTFTAVVEPEYGGEATGSVAFYDGRTTLGSATVNSNSANLTTAALSFGTDSITAIYSGDSNFSGSTSKPLLQVVENASTTTLSSSPNPSTYGNPVVYTVTVTSSAGTPSGTVEILDSSTATVLTTPAMLTLNSGSVQYTTSQTPIGSNSITAVYSGYSSIAGSTSVPINQVVMPPSNFSVLHAFGGGADGAYPYAGLVQDGQGNLYGTTDAGGANDAGTVFRVTPTGQETVIYSFSEAGGDGTGPTAGLIQDPQGNLYGTTEYGGFNGAGTVFRVTPTGQETVIYSFSEAGGDGTRPTAGLIQDPQGNLYGTTDYGGFNGAGTVFRVTPTGQETVIYSFAGTGGDGAYPATGLIRDTQGNLYGTTLSGGRLYQGTVFKLTPTGQETVLYSFAAGGDGADPTAGLIQDTQGNLYGTTSNGGTSNSCYGGCGTVFKLTPTGQETVLYSFTGAGGDGAYPGASLVQDAQGNLYGTTQAGGSGGGTLFKVTATGQETVLFSWVLGYGKSPEAALLLDAQENLYGTTIYGGNPACGCGTVFKLALAMPTGGARISTTLQSLTLNGTKQYVAVFEISNTGPNVAKGLTVTGSNLDSTARVTSMPIVSGMSTVSSVNVTLTFPRFGRCAKQFWRDYNQRNYAGGTSGGGFPR